MLSSILHILYPPKCVLCRKILSKNETDLCTQCRKEAQKFIKSKRNIPFVAGWTALWYYKDNVGASIRRYKFSAFRHYAPVYGRLLGMRLLEDFPEGFDLIGWVPTGFFRKLRRGFDQSQLLAEEVSRQLGCSPTRLLKKIRNNPPQSGIVGAAQRRANVLGVYEPVDPAVFRGKRILLLDDVITTGATCSECARILLTSGAKEVFCAAVAAASDHKK